MKKRYFIGGSIALAISIALAGCTQKEEKKVEEAEAGNVAEAEGTKDDYGWTPQLRLTFEDKTIKEVYFDYVNDEAKKKSEDTTYIDNMKEKTGIGVDEAMESLSKQLLEKQDPEQVDIVTGATSTSEEFKKLAKEAYDNYMKGDNKNNSAPVETNQSSDTSSTTESSK